MSKYLETKAYASKFADLRLTLLALGAKKKGEMRQRDIYFDVRNGKRLKMRVINGDSAALIAYSNEDCSGPQESEWEALDIRDRQRNLRFYTFAFGVLVEVRKTRETWEIKHTKIHLDTVEELGQFLELETQVLNEDKEAAKSEHEDFLDLLRIREQDFIDCSYSELLVRKQAQ